MINRLNPNYAYSPEKANHRLKFLPDEAVSATSAALIVSYPATLAAAQDMYASLQRQTFQNWNWLIVCTTKNQSEQLHELSTDSRIYISGLEPTKAEVDLTSLDREYITLLESSVSWDPTFLEKSLWFLASHKEYYFCNSYTALHGASEQTLSPPTLNQEKSTSACCSLVLRRSAFCRVSDLHSLVATPTKNNDLLVKLISHRLPGYTIPEFLQWHYKTESTTKTECIRQHARLIPEGFRPHQPEAFETFPEEAPFLNPILPASSGRHVLFILPWMVEGGADKVNIDLIGKLVEAGNTVTVCCTLAADHRWLHLFAEHTVDIFILPNILIQADYPRFITYLIESRKIDTVIITGSTVGYQLLPYLRVNCPQTAFIDLSHTEELHWLNGGHPRFGVGYQDMLDMNIVTTGHLAEWMATRGADPKRIRVMHTGIRAIPTTPSAETIQKLKAHHDVRPAQLNIIFAGRMCDQKRPLLLIEILRAARDANISFNALIVGDGEQRQALEALVKKYDLEAMVRVLGARPHGEWLELLAMADVLLMPSAYEGISVALLESMASGVVPVVARVGGQSELISSDLGYLIPHGDDELSQYLDALSELAGDSSALERKANACRDLIMRDFTAEATYKRFMEIIDEAHEHRRTAPATLVTKQLARELATLALEYKRLTEYLDVLYAGHSLTGGSQTRMGNEIRLAYALVRRLSQTKIINFLLRRPLVNRTIRRLISYVR
ncbi:glycosyltransferase family 4 protein [Pseudomonas sp. BLCC-B13]|uniref:glycosyltransferase family 4 protein n=1 Tax=Pseudomonas sp. BLCC-B13 TaxID=3025314 RepID=UPI00234EC548|nr:glycosyltransferase family 4 protein [Pseudomonas sp. BLCC-B13]MDC7825598.1 glycosyltransferase family 4 protein [Pseudomonas sp. BLCC-B13]